MPAAGAGLARRTSSTTRLNSSSVRDAPHHPGDVCRFAPLHDATRRQSPQPCSTFSKEAVMETLVQLSDVTKRYGSGSGEPALNRVSLQVPTGRVTAIMGPSGSGKSTLLNLIGGLDRPTSGVVTMEDVELSRLGEAALARHRRQKIGLIFQFFNLLNNLTALDNVLIPAELAGVPRRKALERGHELLDQLGIRQQAHKYPAQLSGGERQRVAVARAIVNRPVLLLADEPTGALDTHSGEQVMDLLADLNRAGQTILLVTHDPRIAQQYATGVIRLIDGQVADDSAGARRVAVQ